MAEWRYVLSKKLIITEKPSVARDFARVLGVSGKQDGFIENQDWVISWCVGHLVGMLYPESYDVKYKKWCLEDLPFLPEEYKYGVIDSVAKQYSIVHELLFRQDIDTVYWAGDSGKEGQTIEENIRNFGGVREGMTELRVWIDSQTDDEILRGIREAKPMSDYANLGKSGIMRTIEDYALGINFSRVLSVKYGNMINKAAQTKKYAAIAVGRVMTCVLGMVVIREREIRNFKETPFYRVLGLFSEDHLPGEWRTTEQSAYFNSPVLYKENGFKERSGAEKLIRQLENKPATVLAIERSVSKKKPPLLFNLAELQAECAKLFKISPDETLGVAQELYEAKLTTYPRTDARVLTTAVAKEINKNLSGLSSYEPTGEFVSRILGEGMYKGIEKSQYTDDSKVTDHYAIIPTGQTKDAAKLGDLQRKIYDLIVRRFLSIFYPPAEYLSVKLTIGIEPETQSEQHFTETFFMSTKLLQKKGYLEIAGTNAKESASGQEGEDDISGVSDSNKVLALVSKLKKGDSIPVDGFEIKEGKTSPPKRYTSGTMILAMENAGNLIEDDELRAQIKNTGIGTSATRAEIIKKLVTNHYLNLSKAQILTPNPLGEMIFEVVDKNVPTLLNPQMTAEWDKGLEGITNGSVNAVEYRTKLEDYIREQCKSMISQDRSETILSAIEDFSGKNMEEVTSYHRIGIPCPVCGGELMTSSFGFGCSNFFNDSVKCRFSFGEIAGKKISEADFKQLVKEGRTDVIDGFVSKRKRKFSAMLILARDENGKPILENNRLNVTFEFPEREEKTVRNASCPICGGAIVRTYPGYRCVNYGENQCPFSIKKIFDVELTEKQLRDLVNKGATEKDFRTVRNNEEVRIGVMLNKDSEGRFVGLKIYSN